MVCVCVPSVRRGECACCLTITCQWQVRQLDFNIGSGIAKTLEQELVQARSEDKSLDAAVFHVWLTVRRAGPMVTCRGHCFTSSSYTCRQSWSLLQGLPGLAA